MQEIYGNKILNYVSILKVNNKNPMLKLKTICNNTFIDYNMKKNTSFGIGGNVKCLVYPETKEELKDVLNYINRFKLKFYFIGSGSNLLIDDDGYNGVVISLKKTFKKLKIINNKIYAESGVMLGHLVKQAIKAGFGGFESLIGVPGTLGGALIMNAGAYGSEICNYIDHVISIDLRGEERTYDRKDINFSYRKSSLKKDEIIVSAIFDCKKENINKIKINSKNASNKRKESQPLRYRSAGSIFKNPSENISAGYLIDKAGLKGVRIGGAVISEKHANFILNVDNAKSKDVLALIQLIKSEVYKKFNVKLQCEVKIVGNK